MAGNISTTAPASRLTPVSREPRPAASLIVLRDAPAGPEVLLVQRNPEQRFMGGAWVLPGGGRNRGMRALTASDGLSVAVRGPTGALGIAIVSALERSRRVKRVLGMARRPFDPRALGWKKTEYRQGDVMDESSVRDLVKG